MEPNESNSARDAEIEARPVKQIMESTTSVGTQATVKSALDDLETQAVDSTVVTDPAGKLVGSVSKDQMISGRGGPRSRSGNLVGGSGSEKRRRSLLL